MSSVFGIKIIRYILIRIELTPVGVCRRFLNWCGSPLPAPTVGFIRKWGGGVWARSRPFLNGRKSRISNNNNNNGNDINNNNNTNSGQVQLGLARNNRVPKFHLKPSLSLSTWGQIISLVAMVSTICCQSSNSCHWKPSLKLRISLRCSKSDHLILRRPIKKATVVVYVWRLSHLLCSFWRLPFYCSCNIWIATVKLYGNATEGVQLH